MLNHHTLRGHIARYEPRSQKKTTRSDRVTVTERRRWLTSRKPQLRSTGILHTRITKKTNCSSSVYGVYAEHRQQSRHVTARHGTVVSTHK